MDDGRIVQLYWERDERAIPATSDKYGGYSGLFVPDGTIHRICG